MRLPSRPAVPRALAGGAVLTLTYPRGLGLGGQPQVLRGAGAAEDSPHPLTTDEEALLREIGRVMVVLPRVIDADMVREQRLPLGGAGAGRTGTCDADARGWNAVLSDAGLARLEQAWPCHLASARRHVFDHLEDADLALLVGALRRIATPPS